MSKYEVCYMPEGSIVYDEDKEQMVMVEAVNRKEAKTVFWKDHPGAFITRVKWRNDLEPVFMSSDERSRLGDMRRRMAKDVG